MRKVVTMMLVNVTMSSNIEHVMSVFTLFDSKLNQAATPGRVDKMVLIIKESHLWEKARQ